jgi:hypothetical protein
VDAVRAEPGGEALLAAQPEESSESAPHRLHVLDDLLQSDRRIAGSGR